MGDVGLWERAKVFERFSQRPRERVYSAYDGFHQAIENMNNAIHLKDCLVQSTTFNRFGKVKHRFHRVEQHGRKVCLCMSTNPISPDLLIQIGNSKGIVRYNRSLSGLNKRVKILVSGRAWNDSVDEVRRVPKGHWCNRLG